MRFEYCECGCKGHEATAGDRHYWLFNDLRGNFSLLHGHGWNGTPMGTYKKFDDAVAAAMADAKLALLKMAGDINE